MSNSIKVCYSRTVNLENYNSLKVSAEAEMELTAHGADRKAVYNSLWDEVTKQVHDKIMRESTINIASKKKRR